MMVVEEKEGWIYIAFIGMVCDRDTWADLAAPRAARDELVL